MKQKQYSLDNKSDCHFYRRKVCMYDPKNTILTTSIMILACVSANSAGALRKHVMGRMGREFNLISQETKSGEKTRQPDNDPEHTAKLTLDCCLK